MAIFDKSTIENFAGEIHDEVVDSALSTFSFILGNAMQDFAKANALVGSEYEILPINEFFSGAVLPNSKVDLLLILKSPQLELNTSKIIKNKAKSLWTRLKFSWRNRKRRKKKDKYITKIKVDPRLDRDKYTLYHFGIDLVEHISKHIPKECVVALYNGVLEIGGQGLAFPCRIYPVIDKGETFNFYQVRKNKFINIDLGKRAVHLQELLEIYGERYLQLVKIFMAVYYNINSHMPNAIFVESLVANLPKDAFLSDDIYERFIFSVNYLFNTKQNELFSIRNTSKRLLADELTQISNMEYTEFLKSLQKLL